MVDLSVRKPHKLIGKVLFSIMEAIAMGFFCWSVNEETTTGKEWQKSCSDLVRKILP
jgi:hypothetical protein